MKPAIIPPELRLAAIGLLVSGLVAGAVIGLMAAALLTAGSPAPFTCTEYSPITGKCVVLVNQQEKSRYD